MEKTVLRRPGQVLDVLPQPLVLHMVQIIPDPRMERLPVQALVSARVLVPAHIPVPVTMEPQPAPVPMLVLVTMEPQPAQVQDLIPAQVTMGPQPVQVPEQPPGQAQERQQGQVRVPQHALVQELLPDLLQITIQHEAPEVAVLQQEEVKLRPHPMRVEVLHPRIDHHPILQVTAALPMVPIRPEEVIQAPEVIPVADPIPVVVADVADADNIIAQTC